MPFLRAVGPAASQPQPVELRSAKTLVGSGASTCDLVLPRDRGVLELHALLNLGDDHATATLVPFSATSDGACFLNGRLVPPEGAAVVHGDRLAFGSADNAFVFSLSKPSPPVETAASLQNSRSFRRTLDALRGDHRAAPASSTPSVSHPTNRKTEATTHKSLSASASRERLERFLLDASTDSLLGDFVERKLRGSSSAAGSRRSRMLQQRPTAMEPPPSLSASSISSLQSSLNDSMLDRTAANQNKDATASTGDIDPLLSTAERNYAEIEKLRLSQRLREVNNVLNGHLNFSSSYLSTERHSLVSASMRYSSPPKPDRRSLAGQEGDDHEEEEESFEELPVLVEKPKRKAADDLARTPSKPSVLAQPSPSPSAKSSMASIRGKSLRTDPIPAHEDSLGNEEDIDVPVDESLPSFSEAILKQRMRGEDDREAHVASTSPAIQSTTATSGSSAPLTNRVKARPQLHQQLIDRTLRHKRHETLTGAFHRWRRGLRIQEQRRQTTAKQLQLVGKKLQLLRRNHSFVRWRQWTARKHQVLECREEAFEQRRQVRVMRGSWMQWMVSTCQTKLRRRLLTRFIMSVGTGRLRSGFQRWRVLVQGSRTESREHALLTNHQADTEKRMYAIASNHHQARVVSSFVQRVLRAWQRVASFSSKRKRVLYRMLTCHSRRHQLQAWNTWKHRTALMRQADLIDQRHREELVETTAAAGQQLETREQQLRDQHEKQLNMLRTKVEEQQRALRAIEIEKLEAKKRLADAKASARTQWNTVVERLLKQAIAEADAQITTVTTRLEALLQQMDMEPENARFQAASFLIESMLEQKLRHANDRVHAQEDLLRAMRTSSSLQHDSSVDTKPAATAWKSALTNNARFLLEMVQQRHARLHQLYQAIAKLAATVVEPQQRNTHSGRASTVRVDAAKFKHAAFLTDAMHDRTLQHLDDVLSIQHHRCVTGGLHSTTREARKY